MTTKVKIMYEALKQFSTRGFQAVSIRDITGALELAPSAIYKHYKNKDEIFNCIIEESKQRFFKEFTSFDLSKSDWSMVEEMCISMFRFQTQDEWIGMFRKLLVIEQYKSEEMYNLYRKFFIDIEVENTTNIMNNLISHGYIKDRGAKAMAIEFYAPFYMYHMSNVITDETYELLRQHVKNFRENYRII